jgi:hypothetical protein
LRPVPHEARFRGPAGTILRIPVVACPRMGP